MRSHWSSHGLIVLSESAYSGHVYTVKPAWHNLWAVTSINAQLWLQVLHNHVDNQRAVQLHIVQALVLEVGAQGAAGLFGILQDLFLSILQCAHREVLQSSS